MRFCFLCVILCIYPHDGNLVTKTYPGTMWNEACMIIYRFTQAGRNIVKSLQKSLEAIYSNKDIFILVYEYLPWVPLVESPKEKWRKSFQQPKRFSLPTWWFFWRKINIILPRCVDYTIERYNRWSIYNFEFIFI